MSRTSVETGDLAPQPQGGGGLEKNGPHPSQGAPTPPAGRIARRRSGVWRRLMLPFVAAAVCGTGAFVVSNYYMTRWYSTAETIWFPVTGNQGAGSLLSSLTGNSGGDATGSVPILNGLYNSPQFGAGPSTAITALDSGRAKGEVLSKLNLAQRWHLTPDQAGERFSKNVTYGLDKDGLLLIQVNDTNPRLAYQILTSYVQAMRDVSTEMSTSLSHKNLVAVRRRYANAHAALLRQEDELVTLQKHQAQAMPMGSAVTGAYADLTRQADAVRVDLDTTNAEIAAQLRTAQKTYGDSLALPTSVPFSNSTIQDLRKAEDEFQRVSAIYGPSYPGYQEAQNRLDQARAQAKAEMQRQLAATTQFVSPEMATLYIKRATQQTQLASLSQEAAARHADMLSLPDAQRREADLNRAISQSNALDSVLQQAVTQAELAEKRDVPTYEVMDAAGVPIKPSLPRVGYTTALATVAGFLLALAWLTAQNLLRHPASLAQLRRLGKIYGVADEDEENLAAIGGGFSAALPEHNASWLSLPGVPAEAARPSEQERSETKASIETGRS